mmetsp:Transcript_132919/g.242023  ORF Transcript_132919/g.242023 Transcript_132919/m.242023 type:complete len:257 (+) Transcript_132919:1097-1867(+)
MVMRLPCSMPFTRAILARRCSSSTFGPASSGSSLGTTCGAYCFGRRPTQVPTEGACSQVTGASLAASLSSAAAAALGMQERSRWLVTGVAVAPMDRATPTPPPAKSSGCGIHVAARWLSTGSTAAGAVAADGVAAADITMDGALECRHWPGVTRSKAAGVVVSSCVVRCTSGSVTLAEVVIVEVARFSVLGADSGEGSTCSAGTKKSAGRLFTRGSSGRNLEIEVPGGCVNFTGYMSEIEPKPLIALVSDPAADSM